MYGRGLHMLVAQPRQVRMFNHMIKMQQQYLNNQFSIVNINQVSPTTSILPLTKLLFSVESFRWEKKEEGQEDRRRDD